MEFVCKRVDKVYGCFSDIKWFKDCLMIVVELFMVFFILNYFIMKYLFVGCRE